MDSPSLVAINTLMFRGFDLSTAFREIAGLGARFVEPAFISSYDPQYDDAYFSDQNARQLTTELAQNGLKLVAVACHIDLGAQSAVKSFSRRLSFASRLGARIVITNASRLQMMGSLLANLRELSSYARKLDLVIALENPGDGTDSVLPSGAAAADVIRKLDLDSVRLNYDFSNAFTYSKGAVRPEEDYKNVLPWAVHFHLKDVKPIADGWEFAEIGSGVIDYKKVFRELLSTERSWPMSIEMPLSFCRDRQFSMQRISKDACPSLDSIRSKVAKSLSFLQMCLRPAEWHGR